MVAFLKEKEWAGQKEMNHGGGCQNTSLLVCLQQMWTSPSQQQPTLVKVQSKLSCKSSTGLVRTSLQFMHTGKKSSVVSTYRDSHTNQNSLVPRFHQYYTNWIQFHINITTFQAKKYQPYLQNYKIFSGCTISFLSPTFLILGKWQSAMNFHFQNVLAVIYSIQPIKSLKQYPI